VLKTILCPSESHLRIRRSATEQLAPLLHCGFPLAGVVHTLLGPILPMLAAKWRLDDAQAGSLFIAQFTGAMIGSALSGAMIERWGSLRLMAYGYAAMAAAVVCLCVNSWGVGLVSIYSALVSQLD
jgi:fucose permease